MAMTGKLLIAALVGLLGVFGAAWASPAHAQRSEVVHCDSNDGRFARCPVNWRDARLVNQVSRASCVRNQTWGVDRGGIWVDRGCRGAFVEVGRGHGNGRRQAHRRSGWQPGPGWNRDIRLECASQDNRYQMCRVDVGRGGGVRLLRQVSRSRCSEGYSWGWNRAGVWVDHGCRAQFVVDRRW